MEAYRSIQQAVKTTQKQRSASKINNEERCLLCSKNMEKKRSESWCVLCEKCVQPLKGNNEKSTK